MYIYICMCVYEYMCKYMFVFVFFSGELFDKLEIIARTVRRKHLPFGGIQVILCGDFFQLPPVFEGGEEKYCFEAESWDLVVKKCVELKTVFRQKDQSFIQLLNEVRIGRISQRSWLELQKCCTRELPRDGVEPTRLCKYHIKYEIELKYKIKIYIENEYRKE